MVIVGDAMIIPDHNCPFTKSLRREGNTMIILGLILAIVGYFTGIGILTTIGIILIVVGVILWIVGATGHPVGGRSRWY
jgi:uncharacterized protein DUF6131